MTDQNPRCPGCNRTGVRVGPDTFRCQSCGVLYDDDPTEGGTYLNDPTKRLEREDEERVRTKRRLEGRSHGK